MHKHFVFAIGLLMMLALNGCATPPCDLVIVNAQVWTGVAATPEAQAVAVSGERIVAVGTDEEVRALAGPDTQIIDAGGRRVVPGLTDCHTHIISAGLQLDRLDLRGVNSRDEFIAAVDDAARANKRGQWLLGGRWSVESWARPESPTRDWIDPVAGNTPVFLARMDGHQALANSTALAMAGIDASGPPDPPGGVIVRDPRTGRPTGILKDDAMELVRKHIPPTTDRQRDAALRQAMADANRFGITSVHDMSEPEDLAAFVRVRDAGEATLRIRSFLMVDDWEPYFEKVRAFANDDWVTVGGFKGFMDGSLGSRTAYMFEPYEDARPDAKNPAGLLVAEADEPDEMCHRIVQADREGFQIVVHAIGDQANHMLLDCYATACEQNKSRDRRHRVEHAQHLIEQDIERFASLGVIASMQPLHKADDGRYATAALGPRRIKTSYAYHDLLDAGATVCFGSDWPVVTENPFVGMASAVTARTLDGKVWVPEQSISIEQALRAYTSAAAYAGFNEARLGTIEVGKLADLVILQQDLLTISPKRLGEVAAACTIVGGKAVWSALP